MLYMILRARKLFVSCPAFHQKNTAFIRANASKDDENGYQVKSKDLVDNLGISAGC